VLVRVGEGVVQAFRLEWCSLIGEITFMTSLNALSGNFPFKNSK
jgi:hypothetical protein